MKRIIGSFFSHFRVAYAKLNSMLNINSILVDAFSNPALEVGNNPVARCTWNVENGVLNWPLKFCTLCGVLVYTFSLQYLQKKSVGD